ncbi:MAG: hypothetical protein JNM03_09920 [Sphingopyxis sp.]|uniref:hypothetical protein n=1 Tax=Sphingopyxis sp. TaxID=1908224 RepID=UPI001A468E2D|nr:hypothetical protein [Sphingopyxis sp.]MBL9070293.1 hypothetical protein [Sphingopyxis sp.]
MERLENFDKRMIEFKLERADGRSVIAGRVRPKSYDDLAGGACSEPRCLRGAFATEREELYLDCEKRAAP